MKSFVINDQTRFTYTEEKDFYILEVNGEVLHHTIKGFTGGVELIRWYYLLYFLKHIRLYNLEIKPNMTFFYYIEGIGSIPRKEYMDGDLYTDSVDNVIGEELVKMLRQLTVILGEAD